MITGYMLFRLEIVINPRFACAARVTVLGLCVFLSVCLCLFHYGQ